jgi:hypothetical protein
MADRNVLARLCRCCGAKSCCAINVAQEFLSHPRFALKSRSA